MTDVEAFREAAGARSLARTDVPRVVEAAQLVASSRSRLDDSAARQVLAITLQVLISSEDLERRDERVNEGSASFVCGQAVCCTHECVRVHVRDSAHLAREQRTRAVVTGSLLLALTLAFAAFRTRARSSSTRSSNMASRTASSAALRAWLPGSAGSAPLAATVRVRLFLCIGLGKVLESSIALQASQIPSVRDLGPLALTLADPDRLLHLGRFRPARSAAHPDEVCGR